MSKALRSQNSRMWASSGIVGKSDKWKKKVQAYHDIIQGHMGIKSSQLYGKGYKGAEEQLHKLAAAGKEYRKVESYIPETRTRYLIQPVNILTGKPIKGTGLMKTEIQTLIKKPKK